MNVPGFDRPGPGAGKINLAEFDEVRIGRLEHVHDLAALINDLPQGNDFNAVDHGLGMGGY